MTADFDPGALLARSYPLARGPRVRLRLARLRDQEGVARLFASHGLEPDQLELSRLVRFDPHHRLVIAATALIGSAETLVGIGSIELADGPGGGPAFVLVDEVATEGLEDLLADALFGRADALVRGRAA